jgi:hypothetical protein
MVAERTSRNSRLPWQELGPGLHDALERLLNDPAPEALTRRALETVRRQVARYPRRPKSGIMLWTMPVVAASIAWMALMASFWAAQSLGDRTAQLSPPARDGMAAVFADDLPTVWTYAKAARQSPEALYALLDRRSRQSNSAELMLAGAEVSPLSSPRSALP